MKEFFYSEFSIRKVARILGLSSKKGNIHPVTGSQRVNVIFGLLD